MNSRSSIGDAARLRRAPVLVETMETRLMLSAGSALPAAGPAVFKSAPTAVSMTLSHGRAATSRTVKLSVGSAAPGQLLTIKGHFTPSATTEVIFNAPGGLATTVSPASVKAGAIQVIVPLYIDPATAAAAAGTVSVVVRQHTSAGLITWDPATNFGTNDLPATGLASSGALTNAYLVGMQQVLQRAIDTYTKIGTASAKSMDATSLLAGLQTLHDHYAGLAQLIAPIVSDPTQSIVIGSQGGHSVVLNAASLASCDRIIAGTILGGKGAAPALVHATGLKDASNDPFGFMADMGAQIQTMVTDTIPKQILSFAEKHQAAGNLVVGGVAVAAIIVGTPGALAGAAALGALWFMTSTFVPAGIALSLEGAGNEIANEHVTWANVQPAIAFAARSALNQALSTAADIGAEASGTFARLTVLAANAVGDVGTLLASENSNSVVSSLKNNLKTIVANLHPKHPFSLGPTSLHFSALQNGSSPSSQTLTVTGLASAFTSYHYTSSFGWLTATSNGFGTLIVSANPTGLNPGTYSHPLTVTDDATGYKLNVLVTFTITQQPTPVVASAWHGTLTYPVFGFGNDTANMTWNLTQTGNTLGGSYQYTIIDSPVDAPGTVYQGTFSSGSIVGNSITLVISSSGWTFNGTISGNTIVGSTNILQGNGSFNMQA
jgi:hypothetical protein